MECRSEVGAKFSACFFFRIFVPTTKKRIVIFCAWGFFCLTRSWWQSVVTIFTLKCLTKIEFTCHQGVSFQRINIGKSYFSSLSHVFAILSKVLFCCMRFRHLQFYGGTYFRSFSLPSCLPVSRFLHVFLFLFISRGIYKFDQDTRIFIFSVGIFFEHRIFCTNW